MKYDRVGTYRAVWTDLQITDYDSTGKNSGPTSNFRIAIVFVVSHSRTTQRDILENSDMIFDNHALSNDDSRRVRKFCSVADARLRMNKYAEFLQSI